MECSVFVQNVLPYIWSLCCCHCHMWLLSIGNAASVI